MKEIDELIEKYEGLKAGVTDSKKWARRHGLIMSERVEAKKEKAYSIMLSDLRELKEAVEKKRLETIKSKVLLKNCEKLILAKKKTKTQLSFTPKNT